MKEEIVLTEANISDLINGRSVTIKLPDDTEISIRQSYLLDVAMPVMNERFEVRDTVVERRKAQIRSSMRDIFELGS